MFKTHPFLNILLWVNYLHFEVIYVFWIFKMEIHNSVLLHLSSQLFIQL